MKHLVVLLFLAIFGVNLCHVHAQEIVCVMDTGNNQQLSGTENFSYFGGVHTPKGNLHILLIFVGYEDVNNTSVPGIPRPNWGIRWPSNYTDLPEFADSSSINELFNSDPSTITYPNDTQNLSELYYLMSDGKFLLTADIYKQQVPVKFRPGAPQGDHLDSMNLEALEWITQNDSTFDWSKYDNRTNTPFFNVDNSSSPPDSILDYVIFMHRREGDAFTGLSAIQNGPTDVIHSFRTPDGRKVIDGHYGSVTTTKLKDHYDYFTHEFAHNLWEAPHNMGANGINGEFYRANFGWGFMSNTIARFQTANAWERWHLGWLNPDSITSNQQITLHDFCSTDTTKCRAIQIPVSGSGGQLLWIENHQKVSHWDKKSSFANVNAGQPEIEAGIYFYVTHEDLNDRDQPLNQFGEANHIRVLNANGNFDFYVSSDTCEFIFGGSTNCFDIIDQDSSFENPFMGACTYQNFGWDKGPNPNGNINYEPNKNSFGTGPKSERSGIWLEKSGGIKDTSLAFTGDENDAFNLGDKLGLSGIIPAINYRKYNNTTQTNGSQVLNGLSVEVIAYDSTTGAYTLDIKFDDYLISKNSRWCGDLIMPDVGADTFELDNGKTIDLDLSGSAGRETKHSLTNTFANPTALSMQSGSVFRLKPNAVLNVKQHSTFEMLSGSTLIIENGAELHIKNTAYFYMHPNSEVIVKGAGEVIVEDGGYFFYDDSAHIELQDSETCFRIDGDWELGANANFTFTGNGFVFLGTPATTRVGLNGNNCSISLQGNGSSDKVLELGDHSFLIPSGNQVLQKLSIEDGQILMGQNAGIAHENTDSLILKDLHITAKNPPTLSYGITTLNLRYHDIDNILLMYSKYGLTVHHIAGDSALHVENSNFYLNTSGLRNHWGAVNIDQSGFYDNTTGLSLIGLVHPSQFIQSSADSNTTGIHIQGGNADFFFDEGTANGNSIGVEAFGDVTFRAHCGEVFDNSTFGFSMNQQAILDLSDFPAQKPTQLDASKNPVTVDLDRSGVVRLFGGFNDLEPDNMASPNVLKGTMLDSCRTWDASHNTWNIANQSPVSGTDYDVTSAIAGLGSCNIIFTDSTPLTSSYTCDQIPTGGGGIYDPNIVALFYDCSVCPDIIINVGDEEDDTLALHVAVQNAVLLMRQYDHDLFSTRSDLNAADQLLQILE